MPESYFKIECESSPRTPEGLVFYSKYIVPMIERPIMFRYMICVSEVFEVYYFSVTRKIMRAKYIGLHRSGKLMSVTEQKLLPSRFPV